MGNKGQAKHLIGGGITEGSNRPLQYTDKTDGASLSNLTRESTFASNESLEELMPIAKGVIESDVNEVRRCLQEDLGLLHVVVKGGKLPLHLACHHKNLNIVKELLDQGAEIDALDERGLTALHICVTVSWQDGIEELVNQGATLDKKSEPPENGTIKRVETALHSAIRHGDLGTTLILLKHQPDLTICDNEGATVMHIASQASNVSILQQLLSENTCKEMFKKHPKDHFGNSILHSALRLSNELIRIDETGIQDTIKFLVDSGMDVDLVNNKKETPLFMASREMLDTVVKTLLSLKANPCIVTRFKQNVLHAACQKGCPVTLKYLLDTGLLEEMVMAADSNGEEPFHLAVKSSSVECCELLLKHGDHLTHRDQNGKTHCSLVLNNLPSAMELLQHLLDGHVKVDSISRLSPEFKITFDYSVLLPKDKHGLQSSIVYELINSDCQPLLQHPLIDSFLHIKFNKIRPLYYISVCFFFLYLVLHSWFITNTFCRDPFKWSEHSTALLLLRVFHSFLFFAILIPELFLMIANIKKYVSHFETYIKLIAMSTSCFYIFSSKIMDANQVDMEIERGVAAISIFFTWAQFMMILGRFPSQGDYILMFSYTLKSYAKFLFTFSSLLIGFSLCFMILFQDDPIFGSFHRSIIKTLMMMIGEIEYSSLIEGEKKPFISILTSVFLVLFLFLVSVLMANLLVGLAVNDIPALQHQGKIHRLAKQASYMTSIDQIVVLLGHLHCLPKCLRQSIYSHCSIEHQVTIHPNVKSKMYDEDPLDLMDVKVPKKKWSPVLNLSPETIQNAINIRSMDDEFSHLMTSNYDFLTQLKAFQRQYSKDRRVMDRKLEELSKTSSDQLIMKKLDEVQKTLQFLLQQRKQSHA
ncbi:unnamed protein product [Meganyctiphanes norvegica]|uniref:Ion transport domain-containing protein n=1 Tax=Meganyctiphanes norvegica TaxID=48144 RepID=A0AAV2RXE2_MEGNR